MWVATQDGFYSAVVNKDNPDEMVVRTRARADALFLKDWLENEHGVKTSLVFPKRTTDYPYRLIMSRELWGSYLVYATELAEYTNFKSRIHEVNEARAETYSSVWATLLRIENENRPRTKPSIGALFAANSYSSYWDDLDEEHAGLVKSLHDLTDEEWRDLMEEPPAPNPRRGNRRRRRNRRT